MLNAETLFQQLAAIPEEDRKKLTIFNRVAPAGVGHVNIEYVDRAVVNTYGFFGCDEPCIILENERFIPEDDDFWNDE